MVDNVKTYLRNWNSVTFNAHTCNITTDNDCRTQCSNIISHKNFHYVSFLSLFFIFWYCAVDKAGFCQLLCARYLINSLLQQRWWLD